MPIPLIPVIAALAAGGTLVPHAAGGFIVTSAIGGYVTVSNIRGKPHRADVLLCPAFHRSPTVRGFGTCPWTNCEF